MSTLIQQKKASSSSLDRQKKSFHRLRKKIENLQRKMRSEEQELDAALKFFHETLHPQKMALRIALEQFIKLVYAQYKTCRELSKNERGLLREILLNRIDQLFSIMLFKDASVEVQEIFKDLEGISCDEALSCELETAKKEMQAMFREKGIDIDLSALDLKDGLYDIQEKLFEAMKDAKLRMEEEALHKPKNKRELERERKEQELETLQKRGLNAIYKQLAKAFHPDLEQDPELKVQKEELMKRLTQAYESDDLYTILSLEMEWMRGAEYDERVQSDEQLKIYNSLLKDQIESLEATICMLSLNAKYLPIQNYLDDEYSPTCALEIAYIMLKEDVIAFRSLNRDLEANAYATVRTLLQVCPRAT